MYGPNESGTQEAMVSRRPVFKVLLVLAVAAMLALATAGPAWAQTVSSTQTAVAGDGSNISQQSSQNVVGDVSVSGGSDVSVTQGSFQSAFQSGFPFQGGFPLDDDDNGFGGGMGGNVGGGFDDDDNGFDDDDNGFGAAPAGGGAGGGFDDDDNGFDDDDNGFDD